MLVAVVAGLFGFINVATGAALVARSCFALFFCLPAHIAVVLAMA